MPKFDVLNPGHLIPLMFSQFDVADAQAAVDMNILETGAVSGTLTVTQYPIPFAFDVVGISIESNEARTGGTLTVEPGINGTATGLTAALDATNTTRHTSTQLRGLDSGAAGDRVSVRLTTAGTFAPVTADVVVVVWVYVYSLTS